MARPLKVLIVEDSEDDCLLVVRELRRAGWEPSWRQVETAATMNEALAAEPWDLVLSDYSMPQFSAPAALGVLQASGLDLPFIIVSGTVGEDTAVAAMKAGAHDFLTKQNLTRLGVAIDRELREAEARRDHRHTEKAKQEAETRYRDLFERNLAGVYRASVDGRLLAANQAMARIFGFESVAELLGHSAVELYLSPEDRAAFLTGLQQTGTLVNHEFQGRRKDGTPVWLLENANLVPNGEGRLSVIEGTIFDITERKRAERALSDQARLLDAFFTHTLSPLVLLDRHFNFLRVNEAYAHACQRDASEFVGRNHFELYPSDAQAIFEQVAATGQPYSALTYPFVFPDHPERGVTSWDWTLTPIFDESGEVDLLVFSLTDVTERKRDEEKLRVAALYGRSLIEASLDPLVMINPEGKITDANRATEEITGVSRARLIGNDFSDIFTEPAKAREGYQRVLSESLIRDLPLTVLHANGGTTDVLYNATLYRNEAGDPVGVFAAARDITERKRAEEALRESEGMLRQAQKMEAVGRLAGGVAHDFNNLLQAMLLTVQALGHSAHDAHERGRIKEVEELVDRGAQLTRQLLLFSRQEKIAPRRLDLNELVRDSAKMLRRLLRENIRLDLQLADQPVFIEADRGQLGQVLMNLVVNAADAMPDGGAITLKTGRHDRDHVFVCVVDTGCGIPPEVREHIFEPFFTTKDASKGTGLGLSVVHGIVAEHGGHIEVASEPGLGTTFRIVLPLRASGEFRAVHEEVTADGELPQGRGERVLVVEDEEEAREGLMEVLTMLGYQPAAVGSAEEAGHLPLDPRFDVLLTDLMLPGASGPDLARGLVERWPQLRVVLMSGYTEDEAVRRGAAERSLHFLQKPFGMETLARELRAALSDQANDRSDR